MADNKEFYRLELVIGTDGVEETEKTVRAMDKLLEQTQRRAAALGKTKIAPSVTLQDKATASANKVSRTINQVDRKVAKPEARLVDKVSGATTKISGTLNRMTRMPYNIIVRVRDMATATIRKITGALTSPLALLGVGGGAAGVTTVGLNMVMQEQGIRSAFKVLLGGEEAAQARVDELTAFAGKTPYKREEIYESSRILQVFTDGALATGDGLKLVGDISAGTQNDFTNTALWIGRLYDAMKSGRPVGEMTSRLQEMGAINGEARAGIEALADSGVDISKTWPIVTQAFSKFDGMMEDMSGNLQNLLLGTRTFFTQNMVKRWGMGIESALAPALKKFREWRSENKETIASIGEWFEAAGKNVTTFVLDKGERAIKVLRGLWDDPVFQNADFFGKVKIAWDRIIVQPLGEWLGREGSAKLEGMAKIMADILGGGAHGLIMGGLEILSPSGEKVVDENPYVEAGKRAGQAFFESFLAAFKPGEIFEKLISTAWNVNKETVVNPSWGNAAKAAVVNMAVIGGASWFYNKFLKGPLKTGGKVVSWLGGGSKASTAAKAAAGAAAAGTAAGVATGAGTAAAGAAAGATPSRIATYGRRGNFLSKALPFVAGPLRLAGFAYTAYETQKYLDETGISDTIREAPKKVWGAMNTPVTELNGKSTADMSYLDYRTELLKSNWNIMTSKEQWTELGNAMLRTWDVLRGVDPEARHKTSSTLDFINSPFNKYADVLRPNTLSGVSNDNPFFGFLPRYQVSYKDLLQTNTKEPQAIQIPEEQIAGIERSLSDLKQQVTIHVNMPPGLVNMTVKKEEIDVDEVVNVTGQKLRDALRFAQQNIK